MEKKKKIIFAAGGVVLAFIIYFAFEYIMYVETDNAQVQAHSLLMSPRVSGFIKNVISPMAKKLKKMKF